MVPGGPRLNSAGRLGLENIASALTLGIRSTARSQGPMAWICGLVDLMLLWTLAQTAAQNDIRGRILILFCCRAGGEASFSACTTSYMMHERGRDGGDADVCTGIDQISSGTCAGPTRSFNEREKIHHDYPGLA